MNNSTLPGVIYPDFLNALLDDIAAAKNTIGCVSVGEFDKEQWYSLPAQIRQIVARLNWLQKCNDRAIKAQDDCFQTFKRLTMLHVKAQAIQSIAAHEYGKGPVSVAAHAICDVRQLQQWAGLLLLIDDILNDVKRLLVEIEQSRQIGKTHLAAMKQALTRGE